MTAEVIDFLDLVEGYQVHPAAECFRLMHDDELQSLAADITLNGLLDPITLGRIKGQDVGIIDGRNRYRACVMAGVQPRFVTFDFEDEAEIRAFVISRGERRDITKGERAMSLALQYPGGRGKKDEARTYAETAQVSYRRVQEARQVLHYSPKLAHAVRDGARKLDDALNEATQAQAALNSDEDNTRRLHEEAPDVAALVTEGRLSLVAGIAELDNRLRVRRATLESGRRSAERIASSFAADAIAIVTAIELGEPIKLDTEQQTQIRKTLELLSKEGILS